MTSVTLPPEVSTPYLAVDSEVMEQNLIRMAKSAKARSIALRPHAKTHKSLEIARNQLDLGAVGLTVATVGEAEIFADAGFDDLFIAYPLWLDGNKSDRLRAIGERTKLRIGADSIEGTERLATFLAGTDISVMIEIDSGHHRSGVRPQEAAGVASSARSAGLAVDGVFTFPGHGYAPGARAKAAADESKALMIASAGLAAEKFKNIVVSGGSTPTVALADSEVLNEMRPGVYVFNDAQQVEMGSCSWADVALFAVSTVVSRAGSTIILDAGSKVLSSDQPSWVTGGGRLLDYPGARIQSLSEHHATVAFPDDVELPRLGDRVRVAPNHVCTAVNLADEYVVLQNGSIPQTWQVAARGANT